MDKELTNTQPTVEIPDFISKGQLRKMCLDAEGKPIHYAVMRKFLGEEVMKAVDYANNDVFYGDHVLFLLQRLMPRKFGRLEENERLTLIIS